MNYKKMGWVILIVSIIIFVVAVSIVVYNQIYKTPKDVNCLDRQGYVIQGVQCDGYEYPIGGSGLALIASLFPFSLLGFFVSMIFINFGDYF